MKRLYLTMSDDLYETLQNESKELNMSINLFAVSILENAYKKEKFDYTKALNVLIQQAKLITDGEFTLYDLQYFKDIPLFINNQGLLKPSGIRLRLGRMFNEAVSRGQICSVKRAETISRKTGEKVLKFRNRSAVYKIER